MFGKNTFFLEINAEKRFFFKKKPLNKHEKRHIRIFFGPCSLENAYRC